VLSSKKRGARGVFPEAVTVYGRGFCSSYPEREVRNALMRFFQAKSAANRCFHGSSMEILGRRPVKTNELHLGVTSFVTLKF
jgi:hypothetical protein